MNACTTIDATSLDSMQHNKSVAVFVLEEVAIDYRALWWLVLSDQKLKRYIAIAMKVTQTKPTQQCKPTHALVSECVLACQSYELKEDFARQEETVILTRFFVHQASALHTRRIESTCRDLWRRYAGVDNAWSHLNTEW